MIHFCYATKAASSQIRTADPAPPGCSMFFLTLTQNPSRKYNIKYNIKKNMIFRNDFLVHKLTIYNLSNTHTHTNITFG